MALGTMTKTTGTTGLAPRFVDLISFAGDSNYPSGGTTGFAALVQALVGDQRTPLFVLGVGANGGYRVVYDYANDKLLVFQSAGSSAPEVESTTANLSAVTFKLAVFSI